MITEKIHEEGFIMKAPILFFSHGLCLILGALFFFAVTRPKNVPIVFEKFTVQKNEHEIQKPTNTITTRGQRIVIKYDVPTQHYGLIQGTIEAPRESIVYKHSVGVGVVVLNTSALARAAYSYKRFELSAYLGYDYFTHSTAYGFGIGGRWQF